MSGRAKKEKTMNWLVGITLLSAGVAFVSVRILEYIVSGMAIGLAGAAKASVFSAVWAAVTTGTGDRAFTRRVRSLRQGIRKWIK